MTDMERKHLAEADRHIAKCKAQVARQQKIIRQMALRGQQRFDDRIVRGKSVCSFRRRERKALSIVKGIA